MTEEFLIFLWKHKLYSPESLILSDGTTIEVIHPGEHNHDSGPDFFNSRLKIGNTIWAGNTEVHVKSSDWNRHNHNLNGAFQNVILHVVFENDIPVKDSKGNLIPAVSLKCNESILAQYNYLLQNRLWIPCAKQINYIDPFVISMWVEKMGVARLEQKATEVSHHLDQTLNNWEEVLYRMIMHSFGFHLNGQPFQQLAKSLPYKILEKHADSFINIEALLFGQAGFLNELIPYDDYFLKLQKEYSHMAQKYSLKPIPKYIWKFLRLRPCNFPTIRLAQMASIIHHHSKMFSYIREVASVVELKELFEFPVSTYWNNHYMFGKVSKPKEKTIGADSIDIILINAVIPVLFMYGKKSGLELFQNRALDFLAKLNPEKNSVIENWQKVGVKAKNAFQSQALIFMKNSYCEKHLCLECGIGSKILTGAAL